MQLPHITMLNAMAATDYAAALDQLLAWDIHTLDLKDSVLGKGIVDLTDDETAHAATMARERRLSVHCLSSVIFDSPIEAGESAFLARHWPSVERVIQIASVMRPRVVRLLAAQTAHRHHTHDCIEYISREQPWVFEVYRRAIDRITDAGFAAAIENEVGNCILSTPTEIVDFFAALDRPGKVKLIWDVQNLWSMGTFPTVGACDTLKPLLCSLHLKGGRHDTDSTAIRWASTLEDASWPVANVVRRAVANSAIESLCLNPSHGKPPEGFTHATATKLDLEFVRSILAANTSAEMQRPLDHL